MVLKEIIEAHALDNALMHNGKAMANSVLNALFSEGLKREEIKDAMPIINEVVKEINLLTGEEQDKRFNEAKKIIRKREERIGLPDMEKAEKGKVVMRFAPFPSGALHIGHTRQAVLNDEYAKMYDGKLILVMDDTAGSEKKPILPESYDLIKDGADWLDIEYDKKIIYKSDRLEIYYAYAEEMIKKGYMYVCSCAQSEMQELRKKGVECGCRHLDSEIQIKKWKKMFSQEIKPGELAVRLKTSMSAPDPAFRDRVMFRIVEREHPRTGKKYRIWPMLDFSWAIDDHLLEITHILRGIDLQIETEVEKFIWNIFKWEHPVVIHTGLFKIEGVKISKSKGAKEVKSGEYVGWNDPRLWSLQSLRDRGFYPEAIRDFIISMGVTKNNSSAAIDVLYAINRGFLEKAPRYFFVENPIKIKIKGTPEIDAMIPLHPSEKIGFRKYRTGQEFYISVQDGENMADGNYRLMHLLNFNTDHLMKTRERDFHFISAEPDKELDVKMIQWLPANLDNIKTIIRMPDNSFVEGLAEPEILNLKEGARIQFERFGFVNLYKIDRKAKKAEFWFTHR